MSETAGRRIFCRWCLGPFEYRSDLISHDYMRRWALITPWGALRLHHILRGDNDRHFHDHPMDFISLILRGGYIEHRPGIRARVCPPGSVVVRRATDLHLLEMLDGDAKLAARPEPPYLREHRREQPQADLLHRIHRERLANAAQGRRLVEARAV